MLFVNKLRGRIKEREKNEDKKKRYDTNTIQYKPLPFPSFFALQTLHTITTTFLTPSPSPSFILHAHLPLCPYPLNTSIMRHTETLFSNKISLPLHLFFFG